MLSNGQRREFPRRNPDLDFYLHRVFRKKSFRSVSQLETRQMTRADLPFISQSAPTRSYYRCG